MNSFCRLYIVLILVASIQASVEAQDNAFAKKVFDQLNEARVNPSTFLEKNKGKIKKYNPRYLDALKIAKPLEPAIWDPGLENMAKSVVDGGLLRPLYSGSNKLCGKSSGNSSGRLPTDPLEYVCEFYTNVHDPDYKYIGLYFNENRNGYSYQWGKSCVTDRIAFTYDEPIDTSFVNFDLINTGITAEYMGDAERSMLREINFVRAYPKVYAQFVAQFLSDESRSSHGLTNSMYNAGMELIGELKKMEPVPILQPQRCVFEAARSHGLDCKLRGFPDHVGSDKSMPWDRIAKQCEGLKGNENLVGNPSPHPRIPVIYLLLDPGISDRGHRTNMLDKNWKYAAIYKYDYPATRYYWVQNFAY